MNRETRIYHNAEIFTEDGFIRGGFTVRGDSFGEIFREDAGQSGSGTDLGGARVIPGLVDIHIHGAVNEDFSDGDPEGLRRMAAYLAQNGITSFTPASMTLPYETLEKAFAAAAEVYEKPAAGSARLLGIHMEGPYFSEKKKGAQNAAYLKLPDTEGFQRLYEGCGGLIRIVDVAPELAHAAEFAESCSRFTRVSVAHTDAGYEDACRVFDAGATHLAHLFNAMPPFGHRAPGVIGAAAERDFVTAELICDGLHVHPSAVRAAFKMFPGRICLISDALRCMGMPDGMYELGGQQAFLKDGIARLADQTIAGAASDLFRDLRNAIAFGIPEETAITAATLTPARQIGQDRLIGSIAAGKRADYLLCDRELNLREVYIGGQKVR